jgi:hypothetical protein
VAAGAVLALQGSKGARLAVGNDWGIQVEQSCVATLGQAGPASGLIVSQVCRMGRIVRMSSGGRMSLGFTRRRGRLGSPGR